MGSLDPKRAIGFWQANDAAKADLDREGDPEGLTYGLYDELPLWMNRYYAFHQQQVFRRFLRRVEFRPASRVLEVGCGSARWSARLRAHPHGLLLGMDVAANTLDGNRALLGDTIQFFVGSGSALPIASGSLSLVFAITVLHHLPPEDQARAIAEAYRVLEPGGHLFFFESTQVRSPLPHLFGRRFKEWKGMVEEAGFEVEATSGQEFLDIRYLTRPLRWIVRRALGRGGGESTSGEPVEVNAPGLSTAEHLFYLPFAPILLVSYPLESLLTWLRLPGWGNYACILARKP